jgi:MSHA biogenesis protein MshO
MVRKAAGFTLVELVIVLIISGVLAAMISVFIRRPFEGYMDLNRRAQLTDAAEMALRTMRRDIKRALPNSVRVTNAGGFQVIEMINSLDGGRYRASPPPGNPDARLQFNLADAQFNLIGHLQNIAHTATAPFSSSTVRLVIYNLGTAGFDAYSNNSVTPDVITPANTAITIGIDPADPTEDHITLNPGYQFAHTSPRQRIFVVDSPIAYLCDTNTGMLMRYTGYALTPNQTNVSTPAQFAALNATSSVVTDHANCASTLFRYNAGTPTRAGLASLTLSLTDQGETVTLMNQVHVDNLP